MSEGRSVLSQSAVIEKLEEPEDTDRLISDLLDDWLLSSGYQTLPYDGDDDLQPTSSMIESLLEQVTVACNASKDFSKEFIFKTANVAFSKM